MRIGLWNIDHPEASSGSNRKEQRFKGVVDYLLQADCDVYVITEANAAIQLPGYGRELSSASPFKNVDRFYGSPNAYHQVAIYSRRSLQKSEVVEPVNGLHCSVADSSPLKQLYGNVITIKDHWSKASRKTYSDRLDEQVDAIRELPRHGTVIAGDFNLRLGWPQKQSAHRRIKEVLAANGWVWPTETREDTVQHVLHSEDLSVTLAIDHGIKYDSADGGGLSDHPFIEMSVTAAELTSKIRKGE